MNILPIISFFWTACCAVAMVIQTKVLAGQGLEFGVLEGFVFFGTIVGYNAPSQTKWRRWAGILLFFPALYCWWFLPFLIKAGSVAAAILWGLYLGFPGHLGFRDGPWLKPIAVSLAWAFVSVLLPFPEWPILTVSLVFLEKAFFVFALAIGYDLIDRFVDKKLGFQTLAGQLGPKGSFRLLAWMLIFSSVLAAVSFFNGIYNIRELAAVYSTLLLSAVLIPWQLNQFGSRQWQKLSIDALMFLQSALVVYLVLK
ncbi:MAG: hypothetical protein R2792_11420 [Saprospiraceae bacterium]